MNIEFIKVASEDLKELRREHLVIMPEPQELFLEMKVRESQGYKIILEKQEIGYCMLEGDEELTELFIHHDFMSFAGTVLSDLISAHTITSIWCQTFDRSLLALCLEQDIKYETAGYLFRQRASKPGISLPDDIEVRKATRSDLEKILEKDDSYFENPEEAEMVFKEETILYFHREEEFIGCGTLMHIFEDSGVYDIGMLVSPEYRNQGFGAAIISYLADFCIKKGWRPNAGCAFDNIASRKTLEKAGFITRDRMLHFLLKKG